MYKIGNYITTSQKGIADGIATLDSTGNVPLSQLSNASGGGSSIYTANGALTGTRTVDLLTHTLTLDGTGSTSIPFTVNANEVYAGIGTFFRVNYNGGISVRGSGSVDGNISAYSGHPSSQPRVFHVGRFGGGEWYGGTVTIGTSLTSSKLQKTDTNVDFYDVNNNLRHKIGLSTGSNNQHTRFFYNGYANNGRFIIGSSAVISTEKISLQGSTLIKGDGTSTGSTLALYNSDTTPVKTWDFLDNGNVNLGSNSVVDSNGNTLKFQNSGVGGITTFSNATSSGGVSFIVEGRSQFKSKRTGGTILEGISNTNNVVFSILDDGQAFFKKTNGGGATTFLSIGRSSFKSVGANALRTTLDALDSSGNILFKVGETGRVNMAYLPTASTGLSSSDLWNENGVVRIGTSGGGGGNTIYTANDSLTGDRTIDLDGNSLSFETNQVAGKQPPFFKVNELGDVELLANDANNSFKIYDSITSGRVNFSVLRNGVDKIVATPDGLDIGIFTGANLKGTKHTATSFNVYSNGVQEHDFYTGNSVNNYVWLFKNGLSGSKQLYIGGLDINTTAHTHIHSGLAIKGIGTAGSSALSIYDNDTTPNKLWDFLDNGNVSVTKSSSFLLSANKTLKVDGSSNTNQNIFELNGATNAFGAGAITVGAYGNLEIKGTNSSSNFKVLTMLGNEYLTLDGNGNNTTLRTKAFDIGTSTTTGYKLSLDAGKHQFIRGGIVGAYFDLVNSSVQFWEAGMTSRKFIVGATALIGTEQISLQGSTLINDTLDMNNNRILNAVVNPSVQETTSTATFTINVDEQTDGVLTAMASATTIASPTGTPVQSQNLIFRFKDNGTARALTWNAIFRAIGITLPTTTTANKLLYVGCKYNSTDTKWDVVSVQEEA